MRDLLGNQKTETINNISWYLTLRGYWKEIFRKVSESGHRKKNVKLDVFRLFAKQPSKKNTKNTKIFQQDSMVSLLVCVLKRTKVLLAMTVMPQLSKYYAETISALGI